METSNQPITRRNAIKYLALASGGFFLSSILDPFPAFASELSYLPSDTPNIPLENKLTFGKNNCEYEWKGVEGTITSNRNGGDAFCVPVPDTKGGFTLEDPIEFHFINVGKLNGMSLDAVTTIDRIEITDQGPDSLDAFFPLSGLWKRTSFSARATPNTRSIKNGS